MSARGRTGVLAALAVASPVLLGVGYSLLASVGIAGAGASGFSLVHLRAMAAPEVLRGVWWSVWVASWSTALATLAAVTVASVFRGGRRFDRTAQLLAVAPLPLPHLAAAVLGVLVLGQSGLLSRAGYALGLVSTPAAMPVLVHDAWGTGAIVVLAWKEFPFLALVAVSMLAGRGGQLEEAARTLGARPLTVFRHVTWPVLWRGMLPAIIAVFAFVVGSYEATVLLAPSDPLGLPLLTLERYTTSGVTERGDAHALVLVAMVITLAAVALHEVARARVRRVDHR